MGGGVKKIKTQPKAVYKKKFAAAATAAATESLSARSVTAQAGLTEPI